MKKRMTPRKRQAVVRKTVAILVFFLAILFVGYKAVGHMSASYVPDSIKEMGEKYPETREFVRDYPKYKDKVFEIDVTEEMKESDIPLFIQWDKRWGYRDYGGNYIGVAGCGPTCLAMVICGLNQDETINPLVMANYSAKNGYYKMGSGTSWSLMIDAPERFGINATTAYIDENTIRENLSSKTPFICSVKSGDFTYSGHFIVLVGLDKDGKVIVNDPNSRINSEKHWTIEELLPQIKAMWMYWKD